MWCVRCACGVCGLSVCARVHACMRACVCVRVHVGASSRGRILAGVLVRLAACPLLVGRASDRAGGEWVVCMCVGVCWGRRG